MHVLVTGGTGYVGSHSVVALTGAGHHVRVLARSPERIAATLDSLNVTEVEAAVGDVTDPASVDRALEGCDAVVHAASVFSMDPRKAEEMKRVNVRGTETVLGAANRRGLDPIVHVSSEVALLPAASGEVLTAHSPVQRPAGTYSQTKADSELVARRFQAQNAPVVSIMPAAMWGPRDPNFGEGVTLAANILRNRFPIIMSGGMHIADVRDVAAANAAVMVPGRGPRGYLVTGQYISMPDIVHTLADLSGRRIPFVIFPSWFLAGFGHAADVVQRRMKRRLPWSSEAIWVMNCRAHCDDSTTRNELGLEPRPLRDTFADTVRWLVEAGKLSQRQAGRLAQS
ncbi:MAG TPA: SDR family NAD(P)-dependent oxidoreductase [Jiangellaceae bacterium]|nr:SDR family NAD(P)-dependent oxidoreductase [Jiangellaceae bacterium]